MEFNNFDQNNKLEDPLKDPSAVLKKRDLLLDLKDWDKEKNPKMWFYANDQIAFKFRQNPAEIDWAEIDFTPLHSYVCRVDLVNQKFSELSDVQLVGLLDKEAQAKAFVNFPIDLEDAPEVVKKICAAQGIPLSVELENNNSELAILKAKSLTQGKLQLTKEDIGEIVQRAFNGDWKNAEYTIDPSTGKIIWPEPAAGDNKNNF
jgi:hypothetical protein